MASLRESVKRLKQQVLVVYYAARDPRTSFSVRILALLVAAYALSPVDLIPDFIPVIGYLDDLIIVPLGILLIIKLLPSDILESAKEKAAIVSEKPRSIGAAVVIVITWLLCIWALGSWACAKYGS